MDFALSHAFRGVSYVAKWESGSPDPSTTSGVQPETIRLKDDDAKIRFAISLRPGDRVFMEHGGAADKLALVAKFRGADVHRIATFRIGDKHAVREAVTSHGWTITDEPAIGEETSDELTARKARAFAIAVAHHARPTAFQRVGDPDMDLLAIRSLYRQYQALQKGLLSSYLRMLSTYNDQRLLEFAQSQDAGAAEKGKVHAESFVRVMRAMAVGIPESEREAFLDKLGVDKLRGKAYVPKSFADDMFREMIGALLESDVMGPYLGLMKETKKKLEKRLQGNYIFRRVFEPLPGCGPLIGARLISGIGDIRAYKDAPALKAKAGYHHFEDGSRARRVSGKVSNWSPALKQGTFLLTQQTIKMLDSPWRARLDQRRAYELVKILRARQLKAAEMGLDVEILPASFAERSITNVNDLTVEDLATYSLTAVEGKKKPKKTLTGGLLFHVDELRKKAGIKAHKEEDAEEGTEAEDEIVEAKDPKLASLIRGVKKQALQKALRWLGQQFLKHIFNEWNNALAEMSRDAMADTAPAPRAAEGAPAAAE